MVKQSIPIITKTSNVEVLTTLVVDAIDTEVEEALHADTEVNIDSYFALAKAKIHDP